MIEQILSRLDKVKSRGPQSYLARCPAHDDKTPSLAITQLSDGRILMKCFAGCGASEIMAQIGLELSDLFPDGKLGEWRSFQTIEDDVKTRQEEKQFKDRVVLQLAMEKRHKGERLTTEELKAEREAFERTRANTPR